MDASSKPMTCLVVPRTAAADPQKVHVSGFPTERGSESSAKRLGVTGTTGGLFVVIRSPSLKLRGSKFVAQLMRLTNGFLLSMGAKSLAIN